MSFTFKFVVTDDDGDSYAIDLTDEYVGDLLEEFDPVFGSFHEETWVLFEAGRTAMLATAFSLKCGEYDNARKSLSAFADFVGRIVHFLPNATKAIEDQEESDCDNPDCPIHANSFATVKEDDGKLWN